ncbi:HSF-type DNA-binding-domain-containing protein [Jimgerdemannia flammicorona]|uniref:HSF-type DNA-binding-domain-containing protein n=1 Tax=Jimgerdemannia flammicorona TaxID=994334 RepID=A0A433Q5I9_9FUNG|nr:HSF-type DNA-binding-domain-containing protein [Jimgerdemannia flammicorona]
MPTPPSTSAATTTSPVVSAPSSTGPGVPDFVKKLFRMLEDKSYNHIVSWGSTGESFVVKEPNEFAKTILPKHFKHSNFASFVRQLNKYDFHKLRNADDGNRPYGEQAWEFVHPKFQCNKRDMLEKIKRKTPSNRNKLASSPNNGSGASASTPGNGHNHLDDSPSPNTSTIMNIGPTVITVAEDLQMTRYDLQSQVDALQKLHQELGAYVQSAFKGIQDEIYGFRRGLEAQDRLNYEIVQLMCRQEADRQHEKMPQARFRDHMDSGASSSSYDTGGGSDLYTPSHQAQKLINIYAEASKTSFHQLNEIQRRVQSLQQIATASPPTSWPPTSSPSSSSSHLHHLHHLHHSQVSSMQHHSLPSASHQQDTGISLPPISPRSQHGFATPLPQMDRLDTRYQGITELSANSINGGASTGFGNHTQRHNMYSREHTYPFNNISTAANPVTSMPSPPQSSSTNAGSSATPLYPFNTTSPSSYSSSTVAYTHPSSYSFPSAPMAIPNLTSQKSTPPYSSIALESLAPYYVQNVSSAQHKSSLFLDTSKANVNMEPLTPPPPGTDEISRGTDDKSIIAVSQEQRLSSSSPAAIDSDTASSTNNSTVVPFAASSSRAVGLRAGAPKTSWAVAPRVLLVEDDAVVRQIGSKMLNFFGCTFDVAVDGVDALNKYNLGNYDIVLMDIVMPRLDGVTATHRIRQFDKLTPIISMTSNTTDLDIMTYINNGMNDILPKPISKNSLQMMLEKYANPNILRRLAGIDQGVVHRSLGELGGIDLGTSSSPKITEMTNNSLGQQQTQRDITSNVNPNDTDTIVRYAGSKRSASGDIWLPSSRQNVDSAVTPISLLSPRISSPLVIGPPLPPAMALQQMQQQQAGPTFVSMQDYTNIMFMEMMLRANQDASLETQIDPFGGTMLEALHDGDMGPSGSMADGSTERGRKKAKLELLE